MHERVGIICYISILHECTERGQERAWNHLNFVCRRLELRDKLYMVFGAGLGERGPGPVGRVMKRAGLCKVPHARRWPNEAGQTAGQTDSNALSSLFYSRCEVPSLFGCLMPSQDGALAVRAGKDSPELCARISLTRTLLVGCSATHVTVFGMLVYSCVRTRSANSCRQP